MSTPTETTDPLPSCVWCGGSREDQRNGPSYYADDVESPLCYRCWNDEFGDEFRRKYA